MSWGGSETSGESSSDHYFTQSGVVYFASSGDSPGVIYPSSSVDVISAGGTQVNRNSGGAYTNQTAWSDGGGGDSRYESRPSFQSAIQSIVGTHRGTPDLAFDASGGSPVAVYNSNCNGGWLEVYGTSVASPSLAGIINRAGQFKTSSNAENTLIYSNLGFSAYFTDVTSGSCGTHSATTGWDFCTGVGVDNGLVGK
jgi:subtilase family serine protease